MFKLDRNSGKGQTHEEADKHSRFWKTKTVEERLEAVMYLNSIAFNFDINNPPRIDKTYFRVRKHKDI